MHFGRKRGQYKLKFLSEKFIGHDPCVLSNYWSTSYQFYMVYSLEFYSEIQKKYATHTLNYGENSMVIDNQMGQDTNTTKCATYILHVWYMCNTYVVLLVHYTLFLRINVTEKYLWNMWNRTHDLGNPQPWKPTTLETHNLGNPQPWKLTTLETHNLGNPQPWNQLPSTQK